MIAALSSHPAATDLRADLNAFVLGTGPQILQVPSAPASYHLAYSDAQQPDCLGKNQSAGWYGPTFQSEALFRKTRQHAAIKRLTPDLAFDGFSVDSVDDIPAQPGGILTTRQVRHVRVRPEGDGPKRPSSPPVEESPCLR